MHVGVTVVYMYVHVHQCRCDGCILVHVLEHDLCMHVRVTAVVYMHMCMYVVVTVVYMPMCMMCMHVVDCCMHNSCTCTPTCTYMWF